MAHDSEAHHVHYFGVFIALCVLTLISAATDFMPLENKLVLAAIVLSVSTAKALFVMMFFMHLKFEGNWKYVLLAPTVILAMGLPLALLPDIAVHYYDVDVPQQSAMADEISHAAPAEADHGQAH